MTLYAQPYNIEATGFYFSDYDDYQEAAHTLLDRYGNPVEEFEIQFIDGECIDCALAQAFDFSQVNLSEFLQCVDEWSDSQKTIFTIAVGEAGYTAEQVGDDPDQFDIDMYHDITMRDLAEQFVDDGLFGEIPTALENYIDYDAIARDLALDYTETEIAGQRLIYRVS